MSQRSAANEGTSRRTCIDLYGAPAQQKLHERRNLAKTDGVSVSKTASAAGYETTILEEDLYSYAIVRGDLGMDSGKLASQASHARCLSLLKFIHANPSRLKEFVDLNSCGTVAILEARNEFSLERASREAEAAGLPWALFTDSGHVMPPHFDGSPIVTALAIGPASRADMRHITKRFQCLRGERS